MRFQPSKTKGDALRRLSEALGVDLHLYSGSSVPTEIFTAATQRAGVSDDGQMPERAERVAQSVGLQWDHTCDSRHTKSRGGATVTLTGMNRLLEAVEILIASDQQDETRSFGAPYRPSESTFTAEPRELFRDWDQLDESTHAHQQLERSLAEYVRSAGADPRSPKSPEPAYDIAWEYNGLKVIVEVKSANDLNRRQQARLGIGQVLEYVGILRDRTQDDYKPVLLLGVEPDDTDRLLAETSGVLIYGPEELHELSAANLLPAF